MSEKDVTGQTPRSEQICGRNATRDRHHARPRTANEVGHAGPHMTAQVISL